MLFEERPWQDGIITSQLYTPRTMTAAGMGLGKSVSTLTTIDRLSLSGDLTEPVLVIAPKYVAQYTWPDEVKKWDHTSWMRVSAIVGTVGQRQAALKAKADIYTINYENIPWLLEELDGHWPFGMVVADESTKLKSFRLRGGGKRAAALAKVAWLGGQRWVNLSGTVAPNGLQDLWGQMWFIDKGHRLGRTYGSFKSRWFTEIEDIRKLIPFAWSRDEITDRIKDVCFSFKASDYMDIQEPVYIDLPLTLPESCREVYRRLEQDMITRINGEVIRTNSAAALTTKLLQLCSGAVYTNNPGEKMAYTELHDIKTQMLDSVINDSGGTPVLVAYHWKSDIARLRHAFPHIREIGDDANTIADWNAGKIPLLAAHPASAGHGLNLQDGGNILFYYSNWWNAEERAQILERIGPMRQMQAGHNREVYVYRPFFKNTLDETAMKNTLGKENVQEQILRAIKYAM